MSFVFGPRAIATGFRLFGYDSIGSTNAEALALARAGDPGRVWLAARRQTAGRGRRGRPWETAEGNLAATVLTVVEAPGRVAATLGFVAGLALERALSRLAPHLPLNLAIDGADDPDRRSLFRLKWPNDLLARGGKLAGILLEAEPRTGGRLAVAVGVGVNIVSAPAGVAYATTSLADLGLAMSAEDVFRELAEAWVDLEQTWSAGAGLPEIRRRWLAVAAGIGDPVAVRAGTEVVRGVFETIDDDGRLVVRRHDGARVRVAAGEVHFGAAATAAPATVLS